MMEQLKINSLGEAIEMIKAQADDYKSRNQVEKFEALSDSLNVLNAIVPVEELTKELYEKSKKWDALSARIERVYCTEDGEMREDDDEEGGDLCVIGEMAASAFGWL